MAFVVFPYSWGTLSGCAGYVEVSNPFLFLFRKQWRIRVELFLHLVILCSPFNGLSRSKGLNVPRCLVYWQEHTWVPFTILSLFLEETFSRCAVWVGASDAYFSPFRKSCGSASKLFLLITLWCLFQVLLNFKIGKRSPLLWTMEGTYVAAIQSLLPYLTTISAGVRFR